LASDFSFDIVSKVDQMELKNAMDQADKEIMNRYDFKGTKIEIIYDGKMDITLVADDEFRMDQLKDIVFSKMLKRGIDARQIDYGKLEPAGNITVRCKVELKQGIPTDKAKALTKDIRDNKALKVNSQIQGEEVRVSSKSKDDLQKCMTFVKGLPLDYPVEFINFR
jgi:uncharacterized protein YajQ (UPF0234 family)